MLLLVAAISAATAPAPVKPDRQARASVRIVRAEPHRFQDIERAEPTRLRNIIVRSPNGTTEQVRIIEYM